MASSAGTASTASFSVLSATARFAPLSSSATPLSTNRRMAGLGSLVPKARRICSMSPFPPQLHSRSSSRTAAAEPSAAAYARSRSTPCLTATQSRREKYSPAGSMAFTQS